MAYVMGTGSGGACCTFTGWYYACRVVLFYSCDTGIPSLYRTENRMETPLLFIQFMGMTFIFGFLIIVLGQYQTVMNKDLGYNPDRVVSVGTVWKEVGSKEFL